MSGLSKIGKGLVKDLGDLTKDVAKSTLRSGKNIVREAAKQAYRQELKPRLGEAREALRENPHARSMRKPFSQMRQTLERKFNEGRTIEARVGGHELFTLTFGKHAALQGAAGSTPDAGADASMASTPPAETPGNSPEFDHSIHAGSGQAGGAAGGGGGASPAPSNSTGATPPQPQNRASMGTDGALPELSTLLDELAAAQHRDDDAAMTDEGTPATPPLSEAGTGSTTDFGPLRHVLPGELQGMTDKQLQDAVHTAPAEQIAPVFSELKSTLEASLARGDKDAQAGIDLLAKLRAGRPDLDARAAAAAAEPWESGSLPPFAQGIRT